MVATRSGGLDGVDESAENVPRVFRFLMDIVRDEGLAHKAALISEPFRSCWGIAMSKRR